MRSNAWIPLGENQMRAAAPFIFAEGQHASRSERHTCIPTKAADASA